MPLEMLFAIRGPFYSSPGVLIIVMTPCGDKDQEHWLVAWQHQAITWTNVD